MPDAHEKRMACQIAAQLPDDTSEALAVLDYVKEIVLNLGGGWGKETPATKSARLYVIQRTDQGVAVRDGSAVPSDHPDRASPKWRRSLFE